MAIVEISSFRKGFSALPRLAYLWALLACGMTTALALPLLPYIDASQVAEAIGRSLAVDSQLEAALVVGSQGEEPTTHDLVGGDHGAAAGLMPYTMRGISSRQRRLPVTRPARFSVLCFRNDH